MKLIDDLRAFVAKPDHLGQTFVLTHGAATALLAELDRLQRLAGAVSAGESFQELREKARTGKP